MENKEDKKRGRHNCGIYCSCGKMSWGHMLVKLFLALAMIGLVLVISVAAVVKLGHGDKSDYKKYSMMRGGVSSQACFGGERTGSATTMGAVFGIKEGKGSLAMSERTFGAISKIEANKITIINNAAQEQVVISQANTMIVSSSTEMGLASLRIGQNIIVFGSPDKDNNLLAKIIQIQ